MSDPANGDLKCGSGDNRCPSGYQCSDLTQTCWRLGTGPDAANTTSSDALVAHDVATPAGDVASAKLDGASSPLDSAGDAPDLAIREDVPTATLEVAEAAPDTHGGDGKADLLVQTDLLAQSDLPTDHPTQPDVVVADVLADRPQADVAADVGPDAPDGTGCTLDKDCPGNCQSCANRVCVAIKGKDDPSGHCAGTCDSAGSCKAKQGQACTSPVQCANGLCSPDGICCDSACSGPCQACDFPAATGTCSPVSGNPHAGHTNCNGSASECAGSCTGASDGQCSWPTSACGQSSCTTQTNSQAQATSTSFQVQGTCSAGTCAKPAATACSGDLVCASATACKGSCASDNDCLSSHRCSGPTCVAKYSNGHTCNLANECTSGNCVDGYCCNSGCSGTCQACNVGGKEGTCSNVPGDQFGRGCESSCDGSGGCTGDGVCGYGYSTCTRDATTLHRMDLNCADGSIRNPLQNVDLSSGYSNYTCQNRYQESCIDDGTFDGYYMEWCDYASPTCVARANNMYACDPGAVPSGTGCSPVKLHRRVFGCDGTATSGEQIVDLVATGYSNYTCDNQFMWSCVDDGSWDGYYSEWCEYKCQ